MFIYQLLLTAHDDVFFATYEMGSLIQTGPYLHNYALSYALAEQYLSRPYRQVGKQAQKPGYLDPEDERSLLALNDYGIYIYPGKPLHIERLAEENTVLNSSIAEQYHLPLPKKFGEPEVHNRKNRPHGLLRCKGLWAGTRHQVFVVAKSEITIPRWIRLGKWAGKVKVEIQECFTASKVYDGSFQTNHPINPADLTIPLGFHFNRVVMPPSSLVTAAQLMGQYWILGETCLPAQMCYGGAIDRN